MAVSKVVYGQETIIDLTQDTVTKDTLLEGETAYTASGEIVDGAVAFISVYSGSNAPDDSLGKDGDIYFLI